MITTNFFRKNMLFRNLSYSVSTNFLNQMRGFLLTWAAVVLLPVEEYGKLVLVTFLITTVIDLSDFGVNVSTTRFIAKYHQAGDETNYFATIWYSLKRKFISFVIVFILFAVFPENLALFIFNDGSLVEYVYWSLIAIFFGMFAGVVNAVLSGKQEFYKIFQNSVWTISLVSCLFFILWAEDFLSFTGFVILNVFVAIFTCIGFLVKEHSDIVRSFSYASYVKEIRRDFNNFGNWMLIWSIFVIIKSRVDLLMLAHLTSAEQVAYYDIANKFTKPLMLIFSSYGQVLTPLFSGVESAVQLKRLVAQTRKACSGMTLILLLGIFISPLLLNLFTGDSYSSSILPLQFILFSLIFFVWSMPFNTTLFALNKPFVFSLDTVICLGVTVFGNYIMIPLYGAIGAAVTVVGVNVVSLIISIFFYQKYVEVNR